MSSGFSRHTLFKALTVEAQLDVIFKMEWHRLLRSSLLKDAPYRCRLGTMSVVFQPLERLFKGDEAHKSIIDRVMQRDPRCSARRTRLA